MLRKQLYSGRSEPLQSPRWWWQYQSLHQMRVLVDMVQHFKELLKTDSTALYVEHILSHRAKPNHVTEAKNTRPYFLYNAFKHDNSWWTGTVFQCGHGPALCSSVVMDRNCVPVWSWTGTVFQCGHGLELCSSVVMDWNCVPVWLSLQRKDWLHFDVSFTLFAIRIESNPAYGTINYWRQIS